MEEPYQDVERQDVRDASIHHETCAPGAQRRKTFAAPLRPSHGREQGPARHEQDSAERPGENVEGRGVWRAQGRQSRAHLGVRRQAGLRHRHRHAPERVALHGDLPAGLRLRGQLERPLAHPRRPRAAHLRRAARPLLHAVSPPAPGHVVPAPSPADRGRDLVEDSEEVQELADVLAEVDQHDGAFLGDDLRRPPRLQCHQVRARRRLHRAPRLAVAVPRHAVRADHEASPPADGLRALGGMPPLLHRGVPREDAEGGRGGFRDGVPEHDSQWQAFGLRRRLRRGDLHADGRPGRADRRRGAGGELRRAHHGRGLRAHWPACSRDVHCGHRAGGEPRQGPGHEAQREQGVHAARAADPGRSQGPAAARLQHALLPEDEPRLRGPGAALRQEAPQQRAGQLPPGLPLQGQRAQRALLPRQGPDLHH
mmetsp:Transcript_107745/g.304608  ORF Transcript_107745/g.304608 Transcript_107745/m.304608 type:complete len:425 (+) Transcript_107745:101-1375(+)